MGCGDECPSYHDQRYREKLPLADQHLVRNVARHLIDVFEYWLEETLANCLFK